MVSVNNHWLSSVKKKRFFRAVDDIGMEVWSSDGTFGEFLKLLSREQRDILFAMQLADFSCEMKDETLRIELTFPG